MTAPSPATALLAALYHESCRPGVAAGTTLAHAVGQARAFTEFADLSGDALKGRLNTAAELLERYQIGAILEARIEPPGDADVERLAQAIHECERTAIDRGWTVVKLDPPRPWLTFADLPEIAQVGRRKQAKYLLDRLALSKRSDPSVDRESFGGWLVTTFQPGAVDPAAVLMPTGQYESGDDFCRRVLQLAIERGAFDSAGRDQVRTAQELAEQAVITASSLWHLLAEIARLDPENTALDEDPIRFRQAIMEIAARRFEYIAEPGPADTDTTDTFAGHVRDSRELAEVRKVLEAAIGRDSDPARSTLEVARDFVAYVNAVDQVHTGDFVAIKFGKTHGDVPTCWARTSTSDYMQITPTPAVYLKALASAKHLCVAADDLGDLPVVTDPGQPCPLETSEGAVHFFAGNPVRICLFKIVRVEGGRVDALMLMDGEIVPSTDRAALVDSWGRRVAASIDDMTMGRSHSWDAVIEKARELAGLTAATS